MIGHAINMTYKLARRIAVAVVGTTVLIVGIALIVLPGPAVIVIPIGLAILGLEFAWARIWLKKIRRSISDASASSRSERAESHRERVSR